MGPANTHPDQLAKRVAVGDTPEVTFDRFGSEEAVREAEKVHVALLAGSEDVFALNATLEVFLLSWRRPTHRRTVDARSSPLWRQSPGLQSTRSELRTFSRLLVGHKQLVPPCVFKEHSRRFPQARRRRLTDRRTRSFPPTLNGC